MSRKRPPDAWAGVQHCRIRHDVLHAPVWRALSFAAKALYVDLRARLRSTNNGAVSAPLSELRHVGWSSSKTLSHALAELRAVGLIAITVQGGLRQGSRVPSRYRFTDCETFAQPAFGVEAMSATFDYRRFGTVAEAEQYLANLRAGWSHKKNLPVHFLPHSDSLGKSEVDFCDSAGEAVANIRFPKETGEKTRKSAPAFDLTKIPKVFPPVHFGNS